MSPTRGRSPTGSIRHTTGTSQPSSRKPSALDRSPGAGTTMELTLSVVCSEDAPFIDSASASRALAQRPLGAPLFASVRAACNDWPRAPLPSGARAPVESSVPTLILSGARDPTGATQAAVDVARHLPNSLQVVTPYYGHSELNACLLGLITTFIERPEPAALNTACAASPHLPPFAIESPWVRCSSTLDARIALEPTTLPPLSRTGAIRIRDDLPHAECISRIASRGQDSPEATTRASQRCRPERERSRTLPGHAAARQASVNLGHLSVRRPSSAPTRWRRCCKARGLSTESP